MTRPSGGAAEPDLVMVAGDWHAVEDWAWQMIDYVPELLPHETLRLVLHVGDFGIWPGRHGVRYLDAVNEALADVDAYLWFVDGNHEDFQQLSRLADDPTATDPVSVRERILWLPRGHRWTWHGRTWLALGGAVSADRDLRCRERLPWWPEEAITREQVARVCAGGPADVMVCHDAPASVPLDLPPPPPIWTEQDLRHCDEHRVLLQGVVDVVKPAYFLHGHYHLAHDTVVEMPHGPVAVAGLDREGWAFENTRVLDVRSMRFTWRQPQVTGASGTGFLP